jgi:hypothetical protein
MRSDMLQNLNHVVLKPVYATHFKTTSLMHYANSVHQLGTGALVNYFANKQINVRFQVLTTASMKFGVLLHVSPSRHVEVGRRFRGAYCLHRQGETTRRHNKEHHNRQLDTMLLSSAQLLRMTDVLYIRYSGNSYPQFHSPDIVLS